MSFSMNGIVADTWVEIDIDDAKITVWVKDEAGGESNVDLDANHAEALETAIRAARLELQARAVGP